jgi:hypothetical protein
MTEVGGQSWQQRKRKSASISHASAVGGQQINDLHEG